MWDIREAALKRCRTVRSRKDYTLPNIENKNKNFSAEDNSFEKNSVTQISGESLLNGNDVQLPPLPVPTRNLNENEPREDTSINNVINNVDLIHNGDGDNSGVRVPPLPAGAEHGLGADNPNGANNDGRVAPGTFVANDDIDEGVILLSKLQHVDLQTNEHMGSNTRSKQKKVNVFCITRCPIGGHFATGSDDGIGRIWADNDDPILESQDNSMREHNSRFDGNSFTNLLPVDPKDSLNRTRSSASSNNIGEDFIMYVCFLFKFALGYLIFF
jgi:hypothetical protein